jgi:hypothetical protein
MPIILRVDVDKPFGHSNLINKVKSKLSEDYWFPNFLPFKRNYLYHLEDFISVCNRENVRGLFYFRICTTPNEIIKKLLIDGGHKVGMHAENTRDYSTFTNELSNLTKLSSLTFDTFTKHGSGSLKLGKHHYAPYEPDKYREWAPKSNIQFPFGNEICAAAVDFTAIDGFFPKMFWLEREYRDSNIFEIKDLIEIAKTSVVPVLIHPCNFVSSSVVRNDFMDLIKQAKEANIDWILI